MKITYWEMFIVIVCSMTLVIIALGSVYVFYEKHYKRRYRTNNGGTYAYPYVTHNAPKRRKIQEMEDMDVMQQQQRMNDDMMMYYMMADSMDNDDVPPAPPTV